jgi:hypothetical protein
MGEGLREGRLDSMVGGEWGIRAWGIQPCFNMRCKNRALTPSCPRQQSTEL